VRLTLDFASQMEYGDRYKQPGKPLKLTVRVEPGGYWYSTEPTGTVTVVVGGVLQADGSRRSLTLADAVPVPYRADLTVELPAALSELGRTYPVSATYSGDQVYEPATATLNVLTRAPAKATIKTKVLGKSGKIRVTVQYKKVQGRYPSGRTTISFAGNCTGNAVIKKLVKGKATVTTARVCPQAIISGHKVGISVIYLGLPKGLSGCTHETACWDKNFAVDNKPQTTTVKKLRVDMAKQRRAIVKKAKSYVGWNDMCCDGLVSAVLEEVGYKGWMSVRRACDYGYDHHRNGAGVMLVSFREFAKQVPVSQRKPGDILSYDNRGHVAIYIGNNQAVHGGWPCKKVAIATAFPSWKGTPEVWRLLG
jgi:hypothetical protein